MDSELALPSQWIAYKRGRLAVELLRPRLAGPGGLYNSGNLIGLSAGLALALNQSGALTLTNAAHYFAGSADAICITVATLVFMVSGEAYHRAWAHGFPPVGRLNWWGDFLSGIGALWLGAALFLIGEPWLAATAGLMHAWGKFGSALQPPAAKWDWSRFHRLMVVLSRVPAMLATLLQIGGGLAGNEWGNLAAPAVLLACYLLWAKADLLLMKN